jgi:hypothetical protein
MMTNFDLDPLELTSTSLRSNTHLRLLTASGRCRVIGTLCGTARVWLRENTGIRDLTSSAVSRCDVPSRSPLSPTQPCRCLCRGFSEQITYTRPLRCTILQPSQIRFTLARIFISHSSFARISPRQRGRSNNIRHHDRSRQVTGSLSGKSPLVPLSLRTTASNPSPHVPSVKTCGPRSVIATVCSKCTLGNLSRVATVQ